MNDFILRALIWVKLLLIPPRTPGRHRACPQASTPRPTTPAPATRPTAEWPRRLVDDSGFFTPLPGEDHDLVRLYVLRYESEQELRRRERHQQALRMPLVGAAAETAR